MTIIPHILLTTLGVQVLGLEGKDIVLAYAFGYGIDLVDHPIKLPLYWKKNGTKNEKHYHWRTPFQEPVALLWIIPLSIFLETYLPVLFFLSHVFLDYCVSYEKRPFYPFTTYSTEGFFLVISDVKKEVLISVLSAGIIVFVSFENIVEFVLKFIG